MGYRPRMGPRLVPVEGPPLPTTTLPPAPPSIPSNNSAKTSSTSTSSSDKGTRNPDVKSKLNKGKAAHKEFKSKVDKKPGWKSDPTITDPKTGKKMRPDAMTPGGNPIELKPNTPSGKSKGSKQIKKYEKATGKPGKVVYYDPNKVVI